MCVRRHIELHMFCDNNKKKGQEKDFFIVLIFYVHCIVVREVEEKSVL